MSTHDQARRSFLIGTAAGVGAAAAAFAPAAQAQQNAPMPIPASQPSSPGDGVGAFFNIADAGTVAALAERIMPGAPGKPGATDAGVLNYIDLALAGAYSDQQEFYRHGLKQLDDHCAATYKKPFIALSEAQQDETLSALEAGKATHFEWPSAKVFFGTFRRHVLEGMFADPIYGGNRNFAGWRLVGFPGAQQTYTRDDLDSAKPFTRAPIVGLES